MASGYIDSPNASPKGSGEKKFSTQSLTPVTIHQILDAGQHSPDDVFRIDGKECNTVTFIGAIKKITEQTTNITFEIDDGTGRISARLYIDFNEPQEYHNQKRGDWKEGSMVRVTGSIRTLQGVRYVFPLRISLVRDYNEVNYHELEVIFAHVHSLKQNQGGHGGNHLQSLQNSVHALLQSQSDSGFTVPEIAHQLGVAEAAVSEVMSNLIQEDLIYNTDDTHWKA